MFFKFVEILVLGKTTIFDAMRLALMIRQVERTSKMDKHLTVEFTVEAKKWQ